MLILSLVKKSFQSSAKCATTCSNRGDFPKQNINNGRRSGRVCQCGKCPHFPPPLPISCILKESKEHHFSPLMRKIETLMNDAIANNKNWQSGNTSVSYNEENGVSVVRLHGNKIAEVGDDFLQIFDGGWQSNTTKSRLNAMIDRFCNATTDCVFQKDFCWFIRDNNVTRDFDNGYIFA